MSFENHPTGTRELIANLKKELAEAENRLINEHDTRMCDNKISLQKESELRAELAEANAEIERLKYVNGQRRDRVELLSNLLDEAKARIIELESWLKPFHGTPEDVKGYEVYGLDPNTPSGLPMIPEKEKEECQ